MAATRRSPPAKAGDALRAAVGRALVEHVAPGARIAVALSGGRDSVALCAALASVAPARGSEVLAIHVHHGLSIHADHWSAHCARVTEALNVPLITRRANVDLDAGLGTEAAARHARYATLAAAAREAGAGAVMLAHHQDDQAETLLLQLGRGAGVHGLAAMPAARHADGVLWLRPLLDVPRRAIDAFVREAGLAFVDDDSNASTLHRRNALRERVVPALAATFEGYPGTIARAASHQAEAARLLDELAALDAQTLVAQASLDRAGLASLAPHRARNLLRWFLRQRGLRAPSTARLQAMLAQLCDARADRPLRLVHDGSELGVHRGRIVVHERPPPDYACAWQGEATLALPHGRLRFEPVIGEGLAAACLAGAPVVVRPRRGGERLQLSRERPRRALKAWLQEANLPAWERAALPLVFCGDALAAVPGLGVDVAFQTAEGRPGFALEWQSAGAGRYK